MYFELLQVEHEFLLSVHRLAFSLEQFSNTYQNATKTRSNYVILMPLSWLQTYSFLLQHNIMLVKLLTTLGIRSKLPIIYSLLLSMSFRIHFIIRYAICITLLSLRLLLFNIILSQFQWININIVNESVSIKIILSNTSSTQRCSNSVNWISWPYFKHRNPDTTFVHISQCI